MTKKVAKKKVAKKKVARKPKARSFVFVGNGSDDPGSISMMGYDFKLNGKAVKVSDNDAAKFVGNTHFAEK